MDFSKLFGEKDTSKRPEWRIAFLLICKLNPAVVDLVQSKAATPFSVFLNNWVSTVEAYEGLLINFKNRSEKKVVEFIVNAATWLIENTRDCLLNDFSYRWRNASLALGIIDGLESVVPDLISFNFDLRQLSFPSNASYKQNSTLKQNDKPYFEHLILMYASRLQWLISFESSKPLSVENVTSKIKKNNIGALILGLYHCISELRLVPQTKNLVDAIGVLKQSEYLWPSCAFKVIDPSKQKSLTLLPEDLQFGLNINKFQPFILQNKSVETFCFETIKELVQPLFDFPQYITTTQQLLGMLISEVYHFDTGYDSNYLLDTSIDNDSALDFLLEFKILELTVDTPDNKCIEVLNNKYTFLKPYDLPVYSGDSVASLIQIQLKRNGQIISNLVQNRYQTNGFVCLIEITNIKKTVSLADKMIIAKLIENFRPTDKEAQTLFILDKMNINSNYQKQWSEDGVQFIIVYEPQLRVTTNTLNKKNRSVLEENIHRVYNALLNINEQIVRLTLF